MSVIGETEINLAKSRAKRHLQRSILSLCISLGLDPDEVNSSMEIPVSDDHPLFYSYSCLASQLAAIEKIS